MKKFYLDIGNSYTKWLQEQDKQVNKLETADLVTNFVKIFPKKSVLYISCVHQKTKNSLSIYEKYFEIHYINVMNCDKIDLSKMNSRVLGTDRLAICLASLIDYKDYKERLIIDAGSCLTLNYMQNNCFIGGLILPNRHYQSSMLAENIPQLKLNGIKDQLLNNYANNTTDAVNEAINQSLIAFIEKTVNIHKPDTLIIFCGGDRDFFYKNCEIRCKKVLENEKFIFKGIKKYFEESL